MAEVWEHRDGVVNGVRLHWVEAGEGPLVILLHGFPEFWYAWRRQIPALAAAGFRVVAPDLRGYNLSERPKGVASYRASVVSADVAALVHRLGAERAHLAGHDWGGVIAWNVAMRTPEVVDRLAIVNAPHPRVFRREMRRPRQALRSWYAMFFQLPALPEILIRAGNYAALERIFRDTAVPGAFTDEDIRIYKSAIARPGALTAALNYYRSYAATLFGGKRDTPSPPRREVIDRPTLVIWGEKDRALNIHNLDGLSEWVADLRIERLAGVSHWVMSEAPERVNQLLTGFFAGASGADG